MTFSSQLKRISSLFFSLCLILAIVIPGHVFALTADQKRLYQSGVYQFDIEVPSDSNSSCGENIRLTGNNNAAKAFNFLVDQGLANHQAAGVVGNLLGESGVVPNKKEGGGTFSSMSEVHDGQGFGIAQWTTSGRQDAWRHLAEQKNMDPLSLELQLLYLWHELETSPDEYGLTEIKKAENLRQATWVFLVFFERPGATSGYEKNPNQPPAGSAADEALDTRVALAEQAANGGNSESTPDESSSGGSGCGSFGTALDGNESAPDFNKHYDVHYDGPPSDNQCTGGFTVGAESLKKVLLEAYSPPVSSIGGYACRDNTANPGEVSIHGVGRALDIMIDSTTPEGLATGNRIRNLLINNAENVGIQVVIWNRHIWSVNHEGWRNYTGINPHTDHLHVEINIAASKNPNLGK